MALTRKTTPLLLFLMLPLLGGCGGGSQSEAVPSSVANRPKPAQEAAQKQADKPAGQGEPVAEGSADARPDRAAEQQLPARACAALPPELVGSFEPRLTESPHRSSANFCVYSTAPEEPPPIQLILELIPSPDKPSVAVAKKLCRKLIDEPLEKGDYKTEPAPAALGGEAVVVSSFLPDQTGLVGDETVDVADWRQGGTCASLIFSSQAPAQPPSLDEFDRLAVSISDGGG